MKYKIIITILSSFYSFQTLAQNECLDCSQRKLKMCGEECALVPSSRTQECQKTCVLQYCSHKCTKESEKGALDTIFNLPCEQCKDQQFGLCDPNCQKSSEYQKAVCQIECSSKRCEKECSTK